MDIITGVYSIDKLSCDTVVGTEISNFSQKEGIYWEKGRESKRELVPGCLTISGFYRRI